MNIIFIFKVLLEYNLNINREFFKLNPIYKDSKMLKLDIKIKLDKLLLEFKNTVLECHDKSNKLNSIYQNYKTPIWQELVFKIQNFILKEYNLIEEQLNDFDNYYYNYQLPIFLMCL